jgi:hypothetical protein
MKTLRLVRLPPLYRLFTAVLCDSDTGGKDLVYSQVWKMMTMAGKMLSLCRKSQ